MALYPISEKKTHITILENYSTIYRVLAQTVGNIPTFTYTCNIIRDNTDKRVFLEIFFKPSQSSVEYLYYFTSTSIMFDKATINTIPMNVYYTTLKPPINNNELYIYFELTPQMIGGIIPSFGSRISGSASDKAIVYSYLYQWYGCVLSSSNATVKSSFWNANPTISGINTNLGELIYKPTNITYSVNDVDTTDTLTVNINLDGRTIQTFNPTRNTNYTVNISDIDWLKTRINTPVKLTIEVNDGKGGTTIRTYTFTRKDAAINFKLKTPFTTDVEARRILLKLEGKIPSNTICTIEACNNAFDTSPIWENITNMATMGLPYPFQNKTKTAENWAVSFRLKIERGASAEEIYISGVGGAFD